MDDRSGDETTLVEQLAIISSWKASLAVRVYTVHVSRGLLVET